MTNSPNFLAKKIGGGEFVFFWGFGAFWGNLLGWGEWQGRGVLQGCALPAAQWGKWGLWGL